MSRSATASVAISDPRRAGAVDWRLAAPVWGGEPLGAAPPRRLQVLLAVNLLAGVWYFGWLLQPGRVGNQWLYGLLMAAELLNVVQALGFWWTLHSRAGDGAARALTSHRPTAHSAAAASPAPSDSAARSLDAAGPDSGSAVGIDAHTVSVDVFVPRYSEPVDIVRPTLEAARAMTGGDVRVWLLDDGDSDEMAELAASCGAGYLRRAGSVGAKAGNINAALARTSAEYVVVFDCDHVPHPEFLVRTLALMGDPAIAFVQTPQYYANAVANPIAAAAWSQQALFFGCIARGKAAQGAMFCCGTNVLFRRAAFADVGGFPEDSVTEDFQLSVRLQERGWSTAYLPYVLAQGLGPEDMASYVSQQLRWARGCLSAISATVRATLPLRIKAQYLLSSVYFLSGWSVLVYMTLPVVRILTGAQPLAVSGADQFLLHFAPYFGLALLTVAVAGGGRYSFAAYALAVATFWVHVVASIAVVLRRSGRFVVTPKSGSAGFQPGAVWPTLLALAVLTASSAVGLTRARDAAMLNNVAFALLHVVVLCVGINVSTAPFRTGSAAGPVPAGRRPVGATDPRSVARAGASARAPEGDAGASQ